MKRNEDYTHYPTQIDPKKDKTKGDWVAGDPPEPVTGFDGRNTKELLDKANKKVEKERGVKLKPFVEQVMSTARAKKLEKKQIAKRPALDPKTAALKKAREEGYFIVGVTNQSGISSRGVPEEKVLACIEETKRQLQLEFPVYFSADRGARYKPAIGMGIEIVKDHGSMDFENSLMVGDNHRNGDRGFAQGMGMLCQKRDKCFGQRSWRYAMIVNDGNIEAMFVEPGKTDDTAEDPYHESSHESVMKFLKVFEGEK